jgi:glycosyltransferase involved in cell wall biosynthesis
MRVLRLPAWQVLDGRVPVPRPSRLALELWCEMRRSPPHVVVSNTRFFPTSALAAALAARLERPLLHIEHGSAPVTMGRPLVDRATRCYDSVVGRWVLSRAACRLGVSQAVCDFLQTLGMAPCGVLPNGVSVEEVGGASKDYRSELGLGPDDVLFAFAGRLLKEKGILDLLAAFKLTCSDIPGVNLHLALAGYGQLTAYLKQESEADDRVSFLGRLPREDVWSLLQAADVFVHPSTYPEGIPTAVLEAFAAGTAVVATPAGGTQEVVIPGVTGLLVPARDVRSLTRALVDLATHRGKREELGRAARLIVGERHDWDRIAAVCSRHLTLLAGGRDTRSGREEGDLGTAHG